VLIGPVFSGPACKAQETGKPAKSGSKWALLIGVDSYLDTRLGKLNYCGADALALRDLLVPQAGFAQDQVIVMQDKEDDPVRRPLRKAIQRTLQAFLAQPKPGDLVLISFSGHGTHVGQTSYLCPTDADMDEPKLTMLSVSQLYDMLKTDCKAAQKIVLVDACRKDPKSGPRAPGDVMSKALSDSLRKCGCKASSRLAKSVRAGNQGAVEIREEQPAPLHCTELAAEEAPRVENAATEGPRPVTEP
jgi:uncharacterized caspase-like protein